MNRRYFLQALTSAGISLPVLPGMALASVKDELSEPSIQVTGSRKRYLILIELQGGNDGLNTLIPYSDPQYIALRPNIHINPDNVLQLNEQAGLHPSLQALMPLWLRGDISIVQGVGYPHPNRSHFRSIEIWETASHADQVLQNGWLQPVSDALPRSGPNSIKGLALALAAGPLTGAAQDTVVFKNLNSFVKQARHLKSREVNTSNDALSHILTVENSSLSAARSFAEKLDVEQLAKRKDRSSEASQLMRQMDMISSLIQGDVGPQLFKVELGSFDTHAKQKNKHRSLLKQFANAIAHMEKTLSASGHWNDVVLMTYSEFGRRAAENGSAGTDHGTAAPHLLIGGAVNGGLYGKEIDLISLAENDLSFTTDFRSVYSSISRHWFEQSLVDTPFSDFSTLPLFK